MPLAPLARARSASWIGSRLGSTRQNGTSNSVRLRCGRLDHAVVGGRIAVGLVHREHEAAARAGGPKYLGELLRALAHTVGIVLAQMRVRVEQLKARNLETDRLEPG